MNNAAVRGDGMDMRVAAARLGVSRGNERAFVPRHVFSMLRRSRRVDRGNVGSPEDIKGWTASSSLEKSAITSTRHKKSIHSNSTLPEIFLAIMQLTTIVAAALALIAGVEAQHSFTAWSGTGFGGRTYRTGAR